MKTVLMRAPRARPCRRAPVIVIANGTSFADAVDGQRVAGLARLDGRVRADRAVRVAAELELGELGLEGIEQEQPTRERVADPEQDLERLVRLEQAEDARDDAQDAGHGAAGRELGRRRRRVQAAVARPLERDEGRQLALEPEHRGVDDRDAGRDRGVVEDVAGLERVGAVEDDVVARR